MARFGNGFGSECHLLRYLGRHRDRLRAAICEAIGVSDVRWLDFPFAPTWPSLKRESQWPDAEWLGLDFLQQESEVVRDWRKRWPHGSGIMNWDAVGQVKLGRAWEWLLVEAKAHLGEIQSDCGATSKTSRERIEQTLNETKAALGAPAEADWQRGYYQFANRLAILHHLTQHGVAAHLLFIYFCGDIRRARIECPQNKAGWALVLAEQDKHLGLLRQHALSARVNKLFLPVWEKKGALNLD
jgi:hypothetical protein